MQIKPHSHSDLYYKVTATSSPARWVSTSSDKLCCQAIFVVVLVLTLRWERFQNTRKRAREERETYRQKPHNILLLWPYSEWVSAARPQWPWDKWHLRWYFGTQTAPSLLTAHSFKSTLQLFHLAHNTGKGKLQTKLFQLNDVWVIFSFLID